jgi:hypothetical protein
MSIKTKVFLKKEELHNIGHDKIQFSQTLFSIFFLNNKKYKNYYLFWQSNYQMTIIIKSHFFIK